MERWISALRDEPQSPGRRMVGTSGAAQVRARLKRGARLVAFGVAVATTPCAGQVEVTAYGGSYAPTADAISGFSNAFTFPAQPYAAKQATSPLVGGRVTEWLSRRLAVEGSVGYASSDLSGTSAYVVTGGVTLLLSVKPRAAGASVYVTGGVGAVAHGGHAYLDLVGTTGWSPVVGVGARLRAGPSLAIRAGLEDYLFNFSPHVRPSLGGGPTRSQLQNDLVFSLGCSVSVGRRSGMGVE